MQKYLILLKTLHNIPQKSYKFIKKIDIDAMGQKILMAGSDIEADHPGFKDLAYRQRRAEIAEMAFQHKMGEKIPDVHYTKEEHECWKQILKHLTPLLQTNACDEFRQAWQEMQSNKLFSDEIMPQFNEISQFLQQKSGFQLKPVAGLISSREFLNALSQKVFFSTQYLRHYSTPLYTPEPDIVHEIIGHVPLFSQPEFASFTEQIGQASLYANDDEIIQLARCYWFSIEFGLVKQNGKRKAYGAGLLSSFGEIEYCMTDKPQVISWDPADAAKREYPITEFQPLYYEAESFEDAKKQLQDFSLNFEFFQSKEGKQIKQKIISTKEQVV